MKYKSLLLSPLGLIPAGFQPADAADLPVKVQPAVTYIPSIPSWAGFYAGVNLGVIDDHSRQTTFGLHNPPPNINYCWANDCNFNNSQTAVGVLGGAQLGYNFQTANWVYGVEADFDFSSARKTTTGVDNGSPVAGNWTIKTGVEALGTARLRLGYAFDRALVYATGGLAYAKMVNTFQGGTNPFSPYSWSGTGWRTGYTVGGGLEYLLTERLSIKGEALYYNLGQKDHLSISQPATMEITDHMSGYLVRAGLNYRFQ
jgi:outer membrane immunogenic protein